MSAEGYTYFIQAGENGPIKIGATTGDPFKRLAALQTSNPAPLRLIGIVPGTYHEPRMHERFSEWRLRGEWFAPHAIGLYQLIRAINRNIDTDVHRETVRLLRKFHNETECGEDGMHWTECESLCQAFGWDDWDIWRDVIDRVRERWV